MEGCAQNAPPGAGAYVQRLEALIEVPIRWLSFGPRRGQLLERA